jgi:hypothetical protein
LNELFAKKKDFENLNVHMSAIITANGKKNLRASAGDGATTLDRMIVIRSALSIAT